MSDGCRDAAQEKTTPQITAYFLTRSVARLERLLGIAAPAVVIERELEVAQKRLSELKAALGVKEWQRG